VVIGDGLGANEAFLEVSMDDAGGLRRLGAGWNGPGARLLGPDCEVRDKAEQPVAFTDQPVETRLLEPKLGEIGLPVLRRKASKLCFDLRGDDDAAGPFGLGTLLDHA